MTTRIIGHVSALRPMDDSTNWGAIPTDLPLVAGYVSPSRFAWPAAAWARFPNSIEVRITPSAGTFGRGIQVLDVEQGDATAGQVPGWVNASRADGQEPTVYTAYGNWSAVIQSCLDANVAMPQFWIALWNDAQDLPAITVGNTTYTAVAHQYADPATSGGDWDASVVAPYWPGVDSARKTEENMLQTFSFDPTPLDASGNPTTVRHVFGTETNSVSMVAQASWIWVKSGWGNIASVHIICIGDAPAGQSTAQYLADETWTNVAGDAQRALLGAPDGTDQYSVEVASAAPYTITIAVQSK